MEERVPSENSDLAVFFAAIRDDFVDTMNRSIHLDLHVLEIFLVLGHEVVAVAERILDVVVSFGCDTSQLLNIKNKITLKPRS